MAFENKSGNHIRSGSLQSRSLTLFAPLAARLRALFLLYRRRLLTQDLTRSEALHCALPHPTHRTNNEALHDNYTHPSPRLIAIQFQTSLKINEK